MQSDLSHHDASDVIFLDTDSYGKKENVIQCDNAT